MQNGNQILYFVGVSTVNEPHQWKKYSTLIVLGLNKNRDICMYHLPSRRPGLTYLSLSLSFLLCKTGVRTNHKFVDIKL